MTESPPHYFSNLLGYIELELSEIFNIFCTLDNINSENISRTSQTQLDLKVLSFFPYFNGDANKLHRFFASVDTIVSNFFIVYDANNIQKKIIVNSVINKLEGKSEGIISLLQYRIL